MAEIKVAKEFEGIKIERLIKRVYPHLPMPFIYKLLRKGKVRVNKRQVDNSFRVKEGDSVILHIAPDILLPVPGGEEKKTLYHLGEEEIILENDDFLAINKPSGFAVHGGEGHREDVILTAVERYLGFDKSSLRFPPTPVHRLDIETSGVLIFAKNYEFLRAFNELQRRQKVYKEYITLVFGTLSEDERIIE
ncbi:MAG: RluA family pseudouridine synthase, partial [Deltaproteobacteria bacterium]|nr:RluA family pseudouridine synthase [Deltaproteobacteria bacterium]